MSDHERADIARQQAELVRSLVARLEPPAGFDEERVKLASEMLAQKRARAVVHAWPGLCEALKPNFLSLFREYSNEIPLTGDGATEDGRVFAEWLARKQRLPDEGRLEMLYCGLKQRIFKATWFSEAKCLVVGVRMPWIGIRIYRFNFH